MDLDGADGRERGEVIKENTKQPEWWFSRVFNHDNDSLPRVWTGKEDIKAITRVARSASLKLLSDLAAICLDEKPDCIESVLRSSLTDVTVAVTSSQYTSRETSSYPLASSTWKELAGLLSISQRFLPIVMNRVKRLAEEAQGYSTSEGKEPQNFTTIGAQTFINEVQKRNIMSSSSVSSVRSSGGDNENEHSTTNLTHRRSTNVPQAESW